MEPEAIIHNSPALDSLKHQQLRSLCARHGLKATGKREHLVRRLKGLRYASAQLPSAAETSPEPAGLDGSFDMVGSDEPEVCLPGTFRNEKYNYPVRLSTDEFGALSADAPTLTKSSSWKDKIASVFGGVSASSSQSSLASNRTARLGGCDATTSLPQPTVHHVTTSHDASRLPHSSIASTSSARTDVPPTPAFRIVEDSFAASNPMFPDCSFVPRTSFDDNSVDLGSAQVWPPRPGVILISPRQSPPRRFEQARMPGSAVKRNLDDVEEDDEADEYPTIRMVPTAMPLSPCTKSGLPNQTPGRQIASMPKRMSMIAASPPRFDLEAPQLPSLAAMATKAMQESSTRPELQASGSLDASQDTQPGCPSPAPSFVFGSPGQRPVTNDTFVKRLEGFAVAKQIEELQRRTGTAGSLAVDGQGNIEARRVASSGSLNDGQRRTSANSNARFDDKHKHHFDKMQSISSHYAARRQVSDAPNKRSKTEPGDASETSRVNEPRSASLSHKPTLQPSTSHQALSRQACLPLLSKPTVVDRLPLNEQGRHAPAIPPRPKEVKSAAQQESDRKRIQQLQLAVSKPTRRTQVNVSPRKAVANPSTRKLPPLQSGSTSVNSASSMFKSTFSSLRSFGSSSSLNSKTSSSKAQPVLSQQQTLVSPQHREPGVYQNSSYSRPTAASLARKTSFSHQFENQVHSPEASAHDFAPKHALSPCSSHSMNALASPASRGVPSSKKTMSSLSSAQRASPLKKPLEDSISNARKVRAKKAVQAQISSTANAAPSTGSSSLSRSPSKTAIHSGIKNSSISSRPTWR